MAGSLPEGFRGAAAQDRPGGTPTAPALIPLAASLDPPASCPELPSKAPAPKAAGPGEFGGWPGMTVQLGISICFPSLAPRGFSVYRA